MIIITRKTKRFWKIIGKVFFIVFIPLLPLTVIYGLFCFALGNIPLHTDFKEEKGEGAVQLYLRSSGVHTDIIVPVQHSLQDWRSVFPYQDFRFEGEAQYLAVGWGEQNFYIHTPTWGDLTVPVALNAMLLPSKSTLHVRYWRAAPPVSEQCVPFSISEEQYVILIKHIRNTFKEKEGRAEVIKDAYYSKYDAFYEAKGKYHAFNTCNSWVNKGLKKASIRTALWSPMPYGNMRQIRKLKK